MSRPRSPFAGLSLPVRRALQASLGTWLPPESLALYARWWQFETWLRQLVYVELQARYGRQWKEVVKAASGRQTQDAMFSHMASEDTVNPLAYLDYSQLGQVIVDNWELFEASLIHRPAWVGRQEELARIRHRIGHMRRPHPDDLGRLEQTLRDIEQGAFIAQAFYNNRRHPNPDRYHDAVTIGWLRREHTTAQRLLDHAEQQYRTRLLLSASKRPWVSTWPESLTNAPGILWHATFAMRGRAVNIQELWNELRGIHFHIVHLLADSPSFISFTFAAADDDEVIADAIGTAFDAVLLKSDWGQLNDTQLRRWEHRAIGIDYRMIHGTGWNVIDESTLPIDIFGAGGRVTTLG